MGEQILLREGESTGQTTSEGWGLGLEAIDEDKEQLEMPMMLILKKRRPETKKQLQREEGVELFYAASEGRIRTDPISE